MGKFRVRLVSGENVIFSAASYVFDGDTFTFFDQLDGKGYRLAIFIARNVAFVNPADVELEIDFDEIKL